MKQPYFRYILLPVCLIALSQTFSFCSTLNPRYKATLQLICQHKQHEAAFLIISQTIKPYEKIIDSTFQDNRNNFTFTFQPQPNLSYYVKIGNTVMLYGLCISNNDSLVYYEDTTIQSFQLVYDKIGANKKHGLINLIPFDSIAGRFFEDTSRDSFLEYMKYLNQMAALHKTEIENFYSEFPYHLWFHKNDLEGLKYFIAYAQATYILQHEQIGDIAKYYGYDPLWVDTVKIDESGVYHPNFTGFIEPIIQLRLIHSNSHTKDSNHIDQHGLRQKLKIVLHSLRGLTRDGMISNIAMDADIDYDAAISTYIIKECIDSLEINNGDHDIINEMKDRIKKVGERQKGKIAKDIILPDVNHKLRSLSEFRGKVIFAHFWGTWCTPCQKALPSILEFEQKHLSDTNIVIIGIALEYHNFDKWKKYVDEHKISGIQLYAEGTFQSDAAKTYALNWVPAFMVIDRNGKFVSSREDTPPNNQLEQDLIQGKINK
jgi:thiol-disulfide isomerase/thioredoxin